MAGSRGADLSPVSRNQSSNEPSKGRQAYPSGQAVAEQGGESNRGVGQHRTEEDVHQPWDDPINDIPTTRLDIDVLSAQGIFVNPPGSPQTTSSMPEKPFHLWKMLVVAGGLLLLGIGIAVHFVPRNEGKEPQKPANRETSKQGNKESR